MTKNNNKSFFIKNYGCQMNVYDSQRIKVLLSHIGYNYVEDQDMADLIILNTCHIREKASEKLYSDLGRIKKRKEQRKERKLQVAVVGCVAQAEGSEISKRANIVDFTIGPQSYHKLPELLAKAQENRSHQLAIDFEVEEKFDLLATDFNPESPASFITIQEGCDKFCRFCVVPYTRGAEVSRNPHDIINEAKSLAKHGVKEIILLGQNVNAYGKKQAGVFYALQDLISSIAEIKDIERIRFITSHPKDMQQGLIDAYGSCQKLMPYLHLPVQSGSDKILKDMNRGHKISDYFEIITKLRDICPDIAISGDFIVGYPGETDEDFVSTLELVKKVKYAQAYSFKYSRRPGTPASIMRNQVNEDIKKLRLAKLQELLDVQQLAFNQATLGKTYKVLIEQEGKKAGQKLGRSPYMQMVVINDSKLKVGEIIDIEVKDATKNAVYNFVL